MKRILLSVVLLGMMAGTIVAEVTKTAIGPQMLSQLHVYNGDGPYVLDYGNGERRVLIMKNSAGIDLLVNLLLNEGEAGALLERNDQDTLTLVIGR